jgi:hypothetical protein
MAVMSDDLPPRVPSELPEMDRLVMLLGSRSKCVDLSARVRAELITLCGVYPDPLTAARWKKHLREIRAELAVEPDPEAG